MMQHLLLVNISYKLIPTWKQKKMNAFSEKKWFVYLKDHHIGPLALDEIKDKMNQGEVSVENYVWAEGMADWQLMKEVRDFDPLVVMPGILNEPAPIS
jgi:hypothetical protein